MVWVEALIPFDKGEILSTMHQVGMVERTVSTLFPGYLIIFPLLSLCSFLPYMFTY